MSSRLRPTLVDAKPGSPWLGYSASYFRVYQAVCSRRALIHGRLYEGDKTCAIGAYFKESSIALDAKAIDEIAAYNDSFPNLCPAQRWRKVMAWLRTKVPAK